MTPFPSATAPVPPPINRAQPPSQAVAVQASIPNIRRGRIRMAVGSISYYVILQDTIPAKCSATRDVSKAAIMEEVEIGGVIEFRFTVRQGQLSCLLGTAHHTDGLL